MGGTYIGQGNTDYFVSEYNFYKDPEAAAIVLDTFTDVTLIPVETTFCQRYLHQDIVTKPFIQKQTPKGKLVHDSYRVALKNLANHYETCDPFAVAVALLGGRFVKECIEKKCYVETEGEMTRGAVIVDWFERYPAIPRPRVKIVTKVNEVMLMDLMTESVLH